MSDELEPIENVETAPPESNQPKFVPPNAGGRFVGTEPGDRAVLKFGQIEIPFRWCPPGTFTMGSPTGEGKRWEKTDQVEVTLTKGFWMMETEVTQELYRGVTGENPFAIDNWKWCVFQGWGHLPVQSVSWIEAEAFCQKLDGILRNELPAGYRITLPTEAQWEYACRAGTKTATAFGDSLSSSQANFDGQFPYGNGAKGPALLNTTAVSSYPPNPWGLYDMHGNVSEWCLDWYDDKLAGGMDPAGPVEPTYHLDDFPLRVLRGGDYRSWGVQCRSGFRDALQPYAPAFPSGFRIAVIRSQ